MSVLRIGHINLRVLNMADALRHYCDVLGLEQTHKDARGNVYLKGWDEWDKYSVILSEDDSSGMNHIAYKVKSDKDLDIYKQRIQGYGVEVSEDAAGALPFIGRSLRFNLPSGHEMCLYAEK